MSSIQITIHRIKKAEAKSSGNAHWVDLAADDEASAIIFFNTKEQAEAFAHASMTFIPRVVKAA